MLLRELYEQDRKTAVLAFGRLNPPTVGHAKLVDKIISIPGDHYLFLSHTQKPKTDPLDFETKLKFAKQFFPSVEVGHPSVKTPVLALEYLQGQGYTDVIFVAGSDRVEGFQKLFDTYNGQQDKTGKVPFKFNSIRVVSAGERDPDADDVSGMSASKMRALAAQGELEAFAQGVPDKKLAKTMFDAVRKGMGIQKPVGEDTDLKEFDVRNSKKYSKAETYKGYEIYVSVDPVLQGQHMAVAYDRAGKEAFRGKGRVPEQAANMIKDTVDGRQKSSTKVEGNATIDFNAQFSREILEPGIDKIYAKIVAGPKLVVANSEYYDDADALAQMQFKPTAFRNKSGLLAMGMTARQTQGAELVANGRYYVGDKSYDEFENTVYDLDFHSVVNDKNEKYSLGKPGLTVGTTRKTEGVEENFADGKKPGLEENVTDDNANGKSNAGLGLTIFDIDDTLMHTTAQIKVVKDGRPVRSLTNQEFNTYKLKPGEEFDFGEFRNAEKFRRESKPIVPMIAKLKAIINNAGDSKVIMLTARADFDDKETFLDTFRDLGIDMSRVHVHRAGNTSGNPAQTKAIWIRKYLETGKYARVRLYDDAMSNIKMFNQIAKEYPDIKFYPYLVTHDGSIKTVRENFADGKVKGKSRPGRVKKSGASCNGSVTALRKRAKNSSGEKAKMYHWCANMKSGKKK